jgi:hypothetical protein
MTVLEQTLTLVDQLNVAEKVRVLEHLSATLKQDLEVEAFKRMAWHEFIDHTAGILANDPIARPQQPPLEQREPLE